MTDTPMKIKIIRKCHAPKTLSFSALSESMSSSDSIEINGEELSYIKNEFLRLL